MNLLPVGKSADYVIPGTWAKKAFSEAKIVGNGVIELKKAKLSTPADKGDDRAAS